MGAKAKMFSALNTLSISHQGDRVREVTSTVVEEPSLGDLKILKPVARRRPYTAITFLEERHSYTRHRYLMRAGAENGIEQKGNQPSR
jgi:hypothetical protein